MENLFNGVRVVDASAEVCDLRATPGTPLKWLANTLSEADWKVHLPAQAVAEILREASTLAVSYAKGLNEKAVTPDWPAVRESMNTLGNRIDNGPGFAVLHGLPIDELEEEAALAVYWYLGCEIAPPVAQKWNGEMIYSVRDTGQTYAYGVRGSRTSVELVFHVDNAFGIAVPDYVGLLCRQPAKQGGISRFCSLYTVHERLQQRFPEALERLYRPMLFDRQKEHSEASPAVLLAPFFSWRGDKLFARANTSLVRKGYQVAGLEPDRALEAALSAVTEICEDDALWYEAPLERGHIQYLNNHEVAHYRSEFEDFEQPERKRHLYRLWHRREGTSHYDGLAGC
jgi:alpha-ketoglutarate-dependent taurine dioxygenase